MADPRPPPRCASGTIAIADQRGASPAAAPVIKAATRSKLARRWHDLIGLNAGRIADGTASIEEAGWELFRLLPDVARGRKTWAEHWKLSNVLMLFNPAPVT